jgi:molybdopterin adenylyltransferase
VRCDSGESPPRRRNSRNYNRFMLMAVLTVSDRCSRGLMKDTSGPAVTDLVRKQYGQAEIETAIVPDDVDAIAAKLERWCALGAALILTVGGTGLGPRDFTPEATRRVIDREAPGLAEAMRMAGSVKHPFAWLSRAVAGLKGSTLIVNLPGSFRGATESLGAILTLLEHAVEIAAGGEDHL